MSMSSSNTVPDSVPAAATAALPATQPFLWSVRRELWENRSIYIAPLAGAGLVLFGFVISLFSLARHDKEIRESLTPDSMAAIIVLPYDIAMMAVLVVALIVGFFYCLSALHSERRERSILFWKSLPVSNVTTVLSKMFVPMVVLPVVVFVTVVVLQVVMLLLNSAGRAASGMSVAELWAHVPLIEMAVVMFYGLFTLALWHAPIYAWLILVSGWAKKTPILWAVLPPLALMLVERMAFSTSYAGQLFGYRLNGGFDAAFSAPRFLPIQSLHKHAAQVAAQAHGAAAHGTHHRGADGVPVFGIAQIDIVHFLSTPGLWAGLVVAAAFLAAAVWMRRTREAI